jgi:transposase, IS30 family
MQTQRKYRRLSATEREDISRNLVQGHSVPAIAAFLGRPTSTIRREIQRNSGKTGYRAFSAGQRATGAAASRKRGKRRLGTNTPLRAYVMGKLAACWSPEQIAVRLATEYPDDATMRISHEAIYQYIYVLPRGELKRTLIQALRQERGYRRKKRKRPAGEEGRGKIADMLSIEERPAEVAARTVPGHWEGDLLLGKYNQSALGTLVERTTRTTLLVPLKAKDARSVRAAYAHALRRFPKRFTQSLTYDQGKEMSEHKQFTQDTGILVYFAHPGAPWERGTNENTNGLIRQFFPKGTEFDKVPVREVRRVERLLNGRPRKVLDYQTPEEALHALLR